MSEFGIVLLAAGNASRMGSPKQLLDFGGQPMVRRAAVTALETGCGPVVVVCGAYSDKVRQALDGLAVIVAMNPDWSGGMGSSIQAGLAALPSHVDGALLALADQPMLTSAIYRRFVACQRETGKPIVAAEYAGTVGVPVLFTRDYFPHLMALEAGLGCKGVILRHAHDAVRIACPEAEFDVDTADDYEAVRELAGAGVR